jgi:hypothetical protein
MHRQGSRVLQEAIIGTEIRNESYGCAGQITQNLASLRIKESFIEFERTSRNIAPCGSNRQRNA